MQPRHGYFTVLLLLVVRPTILCAADVSARLIDRLGRPVTNAVVDIHWLKSVSKDDVRRIDLIKLVSDQRGMVKGARERAVLFTVKYRRRPPGNPWRHDGC